MLPQNCLGFQLPKHHFPWFLCHSDRILASCILLARMNLTLKISGFIHQGQFPYCSGYEARRVQTIFKINLEVFILLKIY